MVANYSNMIRLYFVLFVSEFVHNLSCIQCAIFHSISLQNDYEYYFFFVENIAISNVLNQLAMCEAFQKENERKKEMREKMMMTLYFSNSMNLNVFKI